VGFKVKVGTLEAELIVFTHPVFEKAGRNTFKYTAAIVKLREIGGDSLSGVTIEHFLEEPGKLKPKDFKYHSYVYLKEVRKKIREQWMLEQL